LAGSKVFDSPRKSENRDVTDCPFAVVGVANESVNQNFDEPTPALRFWLRRIAAYTVSMVRS